MSIQSNSRYRKQRFPRLDRRKLAAPTNPIDDVELDEDFLSLIKRPRQCGLSNCRPVRPIKPESKETISACRLDKRARDEHNEQERSRRRELAVIYELIRCSFTNDDLRYLGHCSGPKSIDKLSYPQVLQIAYQLVREEQHNLILFEKSLNDIKVIEKEFTRLGLPVPDRPAYPSILDSYRKVIQIVDNLLKHDKNARSMDGVYEVTPAERAAIGDREMSFLRPQLHRNNVGHYSYPGYSDVRDRKSLMCGTSDGLPDKDEVNCCQPPWYGSSSLDPNIKQLCSVTSMDYDDDIDIYKSISPSFQINQHSTKPRFSTDYDLQDADGDGGDENGTTLTLPY